MTTLLKHFCIALTVLLSVLAAPVHAFEVSGESFAAEFSPLPCCLVCWPRPCMPSR